MNMQLSRWQSWMRSLAMEISNSFEMSKVNGSNVPWQIQSQDLAQYPALKRWFGEIAARPATIPAAPARVAAFRNTTVGTEDSRNSSVDGHP
jgi:hypothetical protein